MSDYLPEYEAGDDAIVAFLKERSVGSEVTNFDVRADYGGSGWEIALWLDHEYAGLWRVNPDGTSERMRD